MSAGLFILGLIFWFLNLHDWACLLLACAWLLHGGSADGDDGHGPPVINARRPNSNPPPAPAGGHP